MLLRKTSHSELPGNWSHFLFPDSNFTSWGEVVFPCPRYQMSGEGRHPGTKHVAQEAGGDGSQRLRGRLRIRNGFNYYINGVELTGKKCHHFIFKALLSYATFSIFRLRKSQQGVRFFCTMGAKSVMSFGSGSVAR